MPDLPERPSLVIFDCDGVLVDTERITLRVLADWITGLGLDVSVDVARDRFKGRDIALIKAEVEEEMGRVVDDFVDGYRSRMFRAFEAGVEPIPGARATLEALDRASVRWCVASNGPHSKMRASLSAASLLDLTGELEVDGTRVFSAYDVNRWKPEPELFLHAASSMRAAPGASVVVEDSTSGVEAAVRAGIPCVAYADLTSAEDLSAAGAAVVVRSMGDVPAVLGLS